MSRGKQHGTPDWVSYDTVVEAYERYHVARGYALQARDIVLMLGLANRAKVLDVGTGTGEAALAALGGGAGVVVGLEPSLPMLQLAVEKGLRLAVVGEAPALPFDAEQFDAVIASLVITHFARYEDGLRDLVRVLKSGGKLGVTTWAAGGSEPARVWRHTAESFVDAQALQQIIDTHHPGSDRFTDPRNVASALQGAGLKDIHIEQREYAVMITAAEYVSRMESGLVGRWMSRTLGPTGWDEFRRAVVQDFGQLVPERFTIFPRANLAVETK